MLAVIGYLGLINKPASYRSSYFRPLLVCSTLYQTKMMPNLRILFFFSLVHPQWKRWDPNSWKELICHLGIIGCLSWLLSTLFPLSFQFLFFVGWKLSCHTFATTCTLTSKIWLPQGQDCGAHSLCYQGPPNKLNWAGVGEGFPSRPLFLLPLHVCSSSTCTTVHR